MKAVLIRRYGSVEVLEYGDVAQPTIKPDQLLVKVHAAGVNPIDWKIRQGLLFPLTGFGFPMSLGLDVAGEVVAVGDRVSRFHPGDWIYADIGNLPGGAYAEYAAVPEAAAALKPNNMTAIEAAAVPLAGLTALQALRDLGHLRSGQQVLINGAAGGVGSFAVQIAKTMGAEVTGVCSSKNIERVESLGADRCLDYTQENFTRSHEQYDIIFDAVSKESFSSCQQNLKPNGVYIATLPSLDALWQGVLTTVIPGKKAKLIVANPRGADLDDLKTLIEAGQVRAVIDRTYPLSEVGAAHTYSESGRAVGKIVLTVAQS